MKLFKVIITILIFFCNSSSMIAQEKKSDGIFFDDQLSWDQIKQKAKRENKYIFLDVNATWCLPCKKMESEIFMDSSLGNFVNSNFISARVQIDTSSKDNLQIQKWYKDAAIINKENRIQVLPTFLFLTPDAKVVFSDVGLQTVTEFKSICKKALDKDNLLYYTQLKQFLEEGKIPGNLKTMAEYAAKINQREAAKRLAELFINRTNPDSLLSIENINFIHLNTSNYSVRDSLAKLYKESIIHDLPDSLLFANDKLSFFFSNAGYRSVSTSDRLFSQLYLNPRFVDSVSSHKINAIFWRDAIVTENEIIAKVYINAKPISLSPDWSTLDKSIKTRFKKINADSLIISSKITFYKITKNNPEYLSALILRIERYTDTLRNDFALNNAAWDIFRFSSDTEELQKATRWSRSAINILSASNNSAIKSNLGNWHDTLAHLLYKAGQYDEALKVQNIGVELSPNNKSLRTVLERMKSHTPVTELDK